MLESGIYYYMFGFLRLTLVFAAYCLETLDQLISLPSNLLINSFGLKRNLCHSSSA